MESCIHKQINKLSGSTNVSSKQYFFSESSQFLPQTLRTFANLKFAAYSLILPA